MQQSMFLLHPRRQLEAYKKADKSTLVRRLSSGNSRPDQESLI